jgi:quercetin dioxygenase-like cupin family protein
MSTTVVNRAAPGPTTQTGTPLPIIALPQDEILTVNEADVPMLKDIAVEGVSIKALRLDPQRGEIVVITSIKPGVELPMHYHTGTAEVYTLSGRWEYREYPDQPQVAGSYLFEPAGTTHTFFTPEDNTEDTVVLWWMQGAQVSFNDDGTFHSLTDAVAIQYFVDAAAEQQGFGRVDYISGGTAGIVEP